MNVIFYHPVHFEKWNPEFPDQRGIGGSETSQIELAWRLAARGHDVISYAPVTDDWAGREHRGVRWEPLEKVDWTRPGVWLLYRCPSALDNFPADHPVQQLFLISQDESYDSWNESRLDKLDRLVCLCEAHAESQARSFPGLRDRICISSNGIRVDLIRELEREPLPARNPHRLLYASSPDRGLRPLLHVFKRAREWVPDLELVIAYGYDNINKLEQLNPQVWKYQARERNHILKLADQPGVSWTGRIGQRDLYQLWQTSGIWCYPTMFSETSCITCMEAQAMGAIPITNPLWALAENVMHGIFIQGNSYGDGLVQARFAAEIVRLASDAELQERIRAEMMPAARQQFNWERMVDQLESWMYGLESHPMFVSQFAYQLKHANGAQRILNVGCADDPADFKSIGPGVVNMDFRATMPRNGRSNKPDVLADARNLPAPFEPGAFEVVVLGDMLEHFLPENVPDVIRRAKQCLAPGGKLVITVPEDYRPVNRQHDDGDGSDDYAESISAYHRYPVTREMLSAWCGSAEVELKTVQRIDYGLFEGWGAVAQ